MQHSPLDWMVNGGLGASKNGWYCNGGWGLESFARIIFYECFCLSFSCRGVWFFCLTRMVIFDLPTNRPIRKALPFHVVTLKGFFASPPRLVAFCRAPLRRGTDDFGPWRGHRGLRDLVPGERAGQAKKGEERKNERGSRCEASVVWRGKVKTV